MKINLNNIGLMIHFRRDVDDRFRNLQMVVNFYRDNSENLEIVIVNDDKELDKDMKNLCNEYSCKGLFMQNDDVYWRTKAFNEASKILNTKYIIAGDTDVIVDPLYILKAKEKFEESELNKSNLGIVYPYNGMFIHLKQPMFDIFNVDQSIDNLFNRSQKLKKIPYDQDENFLVAHTQSKGGMVMFGKQAFEECNGYNPNFKGWGYEDDEILARFKKSGFTIDRVNDSSAIAWHLPHENTVREKHQYYENNRKHSDYVCGNTPWNELENYIWSWKI